MATPTGTTPLIGPAGDDSEGDADTEESGSAEKISENSLFESEHLGSPEKEPLSIKRRIALVGALLFCVFTVFTFAFLLPCHKPRCQKVPVCPGKGDLKSVNWTANFSGVIPRAISLVDMTGYGAEDMIVEFEIEENEVKNSSFLSQICTGRNCHGNGVVAIDGSCGTRLWVFKRNSSFGPLVCGAIGGRTEINNTHCLFVEEKIKLLLLDVGNGTTKWQFESKSDQKILSFKYINDVDGDGVKDVVFVNELEGKGGEGHVNLLSGKTGKAIGVVSLTLPESHSGSNILAVHALSSKQQFVIVGSMSARKESSSLWAISVHDLVEKVRSPEETIPGIPWGKHRPDTATGFISIFKDSVVLVEPLLVDLDSDGVKDVIFSVKENGISILAMNGSDLSVIWNITLPSAVSIDKLFQVQHSAKGNFTDVVLFATLGNHSSSLVVIDGETGKITWTFQSEAGFPVSPIPLLRMLGMKQGFVMWLSKAEAMKLIPRARESREIQADSLEDQNVRGYASRKTRKLLSTAFKKVWRRKHHKRGDIHSASDSAAPSQWFYHRIFSRDDDFDDRDGEATYDNDDFTHNNKEDAGVVSKKFELGSEGEIEREDISGSFAALEREYVHDLMRGYNKKSFSNPKNSVHSSPNPEEAVVWQQEKRSRRLGIHNHDLEQDLNDLANHKQDEDSTISQEKYDGASSMAWNGVASMRRKLKLDSSINSQNTGHETSFNSQEEDKDLLSNHEKSETFFIGHQEKTKLGSGNMQGDAVKSGEKATTSRDHYSLQKSANAFTEPARRSTQNNLQVATVSDGLENRHFPNENGKKDNSNLEQDKKPSFHKRSVGSSLPGSQCVRSSDDDADSYVAVLLMRDAEGVQHIAKIREERPVYMDAEEYKSLFNVRDGDANSTSCLRLVPSLKSEPVLRDTGEGLDLVYTVSFVSEQQSHHVGKVRKMTMSQVFENLRGLKTNLIYEKQTTKRENDYSFSFPRVL